MADFAKCPTKWCREVFSYTDASLDPDDNTIVCPRCMNCFDPDEQQDAPLGVVREEAEDAELIDLEDGDVEDDV